jgi:hypothetical protein
MLNFTFVPYADFCAFELIVLTLLLISVIEQEGGWL